MAANRTDLVDLGTFVEVARWRSFRRAAAELGVSTSAVSHAIRGLEERLGVRLLNRTTRSVVPTDAGERLLARLEPAFRDIAEGLEDVADARGQPSGTIRLNVPREAIRTLLAPTIAAYLRAYPRMNVEIAGDDRLVDIVAEGFDAGMRYGESVPKDMIAVPVERTQRFAVVAAPDYFRAHPRPLIPTDLRDHACIRWRYSAGGYYKWEFAKDGVAVEVPVDGPLATNDSGLMLQAALDGVGIAFMYESMVRSQIEAEQLVRVLEDWCPNFPGFCLYTPSRRQIHPGLRAFIDMVRQDEPRLD